MNPDRNVTRGVLQIGMGWFAEEPGGLNRMYAGLFKGMVDRGVGVQGLVAGDPAMAVSAPPNVAFFARREDALMRRLAACRRMAQAILHSEAIDVVAAHFSPYALPVLDVLRRQPFVFHFHGPWAEESHAEGQRGLGVCAKRAIESLVYRRADRFIVLSQAFAVLLSTNHGIRPERIHVVPGGVDVDRFAIALSRREARASLQLPDDRPVVGVVRRLIHRVGLEGLIDAMTRVRKRIPDVLLLIAGRGPLARDLETRVAQAGLRDHVKFAGFVADDALPVFYRACELSIVPSTAWEGFGLAAIESMASGTPVLVTPVGGLPETVAALDANLVLPDAGVHSIARAIADALAGDTTLPSPEHCVRYARERFDWPIITTRTLAVYA
jgi:glycosyltransferase involved in cell wall biosynthesis